jgi:hypothetical protein
MSINPKRKLLAMIDGMRLDVDGQEIFVIKAPIKGSPLPRDIPMDEATKPMDYLMRLQKQIPVVFVWPREDGKIAFVVPAEWKEKLLSKTILASQWTKVPIYEDELESPPCGADGNG